MTAPDVVSPAVTKLVRAVTMLREATDGDARAAAQKAIVYSAYPFLRHADTDANARDLDRFLCQLRDGEVDDEEPENTVALLAVRIADDADATAASKVDIGVDGQRYTDTGNAERLVALHGDQLRYVPAWARWLRWDGTRWTVDDDSVRITELAKDVPRQLLALVAGADHPDRKRLLAWATKSESASGIVSTIRLARSVPGVAVTHDELDRDPMTLNTRSGLVDLVTGTVKPSDPEALCTRVAGAAVEIGATAPNFERFLEQILPDPDVRSYVRRWAGYCLTGSVAEQVLDLWWGAGRNGKSVLVTILRALLGDYATVASRELLVAQHHEQHPTALADLFRARLATCVELRDGAALDEARIKTLTGGDTVKARRMRENFWSFEPTAKLLIVTNHKPLVRADDFALWRRVHLVPFEVTIPAADVDPRLAERIITSEMPGVLEWALAGCDEWQRTGLAPPAAVVAATDAYRVDSDTVARFLAEEDLVVEPGLRINSTALQDAHRSWCEENGEDQRRHWQEVQRRLKEHGATPRRSGSVRWWFGLGYPADTLAGAHRRDAAHTTADQQLHGLRDAV